MKLKSVLELFEDGAEYWETPFQKVDSFEELKGEWGYVKTQKNIHLDYKVFDSNGNKHSVIWELRYFDPEGSAQNYGGSYLIELNDKGKCVFFHHSCEAK